MKITIEEVQNKGIHAVKSIESETYFVPCIDGKPVHKVAESEDIAMLIALGIKYQGLNSQFPTMACRMLQIDTEWAK